MKYANILIVEDDPISSAVLAAWARDLGSTVTTIESTTEADVALAEGTYDLVLSDVHLPGNHNLEWVEQVLAADFPAPVVLLTGNPGLDTALRAANLAIAGYLVKPVDFNVLGPLAQRLVTEHRLRRELRSLSRETAWLLMQSESIAPDLIQPMQEILRQLSQSLAAEVVRNPREPVRSGDLALRSAIKETITVLEKTKHSFRSKELGRLRKRLQRLVANSPAIRIPSVAA